MYVIGISGGTASGKSSICRLAAERLACPLVGHDRYYRDAPEPRRFNFDHPDALETSLLIAHLRTLKRGERATTPTYDFKEHRRSSVVREVAPTPIVVVEGILLFTDAELRAELDLKLFVDTDADIRLLRRIRRDMEQRGRSFESIREQYKTTVRPMHLLFVEPSKRWADVIIPEGGENHVALDLVVSKVRSLLPPSP